MAEGVTHISLPTHTNTIEGDRRKIERQTNKQSLGLPRAEKRYCNTTCICGLSLAWVASENSTMLLESDILRLFFTGPYLVSSSLCSGVDCPSILPRQLLFCCLPLCSPATNCLCSSATNSPLSCPTTNCLSWAPATNCLSLGRVVNSRSPPRTTSGYGEISCPRILCLVSRQNRQLNRLLWQPTPIVLHIGRLRNCLDAHLGQIVCDKDGVVDRCIVLVEMPLTQFEKWWPLPMESLPELP